MTGNTPLVSVVTPSFNKGSYIEETIQSIRSQTYLHIEHLVIDGGSTDQTLAVLEKYQGVLKWISEPDRGQSDAINKGWRMARGAIIAYLNADDTYEPGAVETAVRFFEKNPGYHMFYGDGVITDEYGQNRRTIRSGEFSQKDLVFCKNSIFQPSVFLKKEVFDTIGDVDPDLHLAMDLDYWLRTSLVYKIGYLPTPLSVAKIYRDAKSSALMFRYVKEYEHILGKLFGNPGLPPEIRRWKREACASVYLKGGLDDIHAGLFREGVSYLGKAFRINPASSLWQAGLLIGRYAKKRIAR